MALSGGSSAAPPGPIHETVQEGHRRCRRHQWHGGRHAGLLRLRRGQRGVPRRSGRPRWPGRYGCAARQFGALRCIAARHVAASSAEPNLATIAPSRRSFSRSRSIAASTVLMPPSLGSRRHPVLLPRTRRGAETVSMTVMAEATPRAGGCAKYVGRATGGPVQAT
jgi:hypothetical protein